MSYQVFQKPQICIFKIPQLSTASKGYRLSDWTEMIWEGQVKIFSENNILKLKLMKDDKIFAETTINKDYQTVIQKCDDSSRGFAIRLENNGKYAWVGSAFRERTDAFDFNVFFNDFFQKDVQKTQDIKVQDFSLNRNKKIQLNIDNKQIEISQKISQLEQKKDQQFQQFQTLEQNNNNQQNKFFDQDIFDFGNEKINFSNQNSDFCDFTSFNKQNSPNYKNDNNILDFEFGNKNSNQIQKNNNNLLDF